MKVTQASETRSEMRFKRRLAVSNINTLPQAEKPAEAFIDVLSRHDNERTENNDKETEDCGGGHTYLDTAYCRMLREAVMARSSTYSD